MSRDTDPSISASDMGPPEQAQMGGGSAQWHQQADGPGIAGRPSPSHSIPDVQTGMCLVPIHPLHDAVLISIKIHILQGVLGCFLSQGESFSCLQVQDHAPRHVMQILLDAFE